MTGAGQVALKQPHLPQAGTLQAAEYQVVDDGAVDRLGGGREPPGRPAVGTARPRIAARVIMGEDDAGAVMLDRVGQDFADGEVRARFLASMPGKVEATRLVVEMGDPDAFKAILGIGQAAGEEGPGGREAVEFQREFGTLVTHED